MDAHSFKLKPLPLVIALQAILISPVWAGSTTISSGDVVNTSQSLSANGDVITVDAGGTLSVSGGDPALAISVKTGTVTVNNSGTIEQTGSTRAINIAEKEAVVIINNNSGASITAVNNDVIHLDKKTDSLQLINNGTIWQKGAGQTEAGQAIDMKDVTSTGNVIVNGSVTNKNALIRADGDDAIRPASNTTITNYGTIISNGIVNTSCPDGYSSLDCDAAPGASDAIDAKKSTNVVIDNYGTISGSRHGISADVDVTVTNEKDGQIIGRNGSGVGSDGTGKVVNYGLISGRYAGEGNVYDHFATTADAGVYTTSSNGDGDGVDIDGVADITNYGRIEGLGGGGVDSGGRPNGGDGIAAGGGKVVNAVGASIWGDSNGILVDDGANGTAVASGRGTSSAAASAMTIENSGDITGSKKVAIGLVGNYNDVIINNATGKIIGGANTVKVDELSSQTAAAAIQMGGGDDLLENSGYIEGKNGLAIDMGDGDDTVKLLGGKVLGRVDGGAGTNTLVTAGNQSFVKGALLNFQNFTVQSGNTLFDYALGDVNQIQIDQGAALQINGNFNSSGLTVNGTLKAAETDGFRKVTVSGNYTQGSTGVLEARVGNNDNDQIIVNGQAVLDSGATIRPVATGYIEKSQTYTLIDAQNGTLSAVASSLNLDSTSQFMNYTLENVNGTLQLTATRTKTLSDVVSNQAAGTTGLLNSLKYVFNSSNSSGAGLMNALESMPAGSNMNSAVNQLKPETNSKVQAAASMSQDAVFSAINDHISAMRNDTLADSSSGISGGDDTHRFWVKGLASWGKQSARKETNGYNEDLQGFALGHETDLNSTDILGFSGGYSQVNTDGTGNGDGDNSKIKSVHVGTYFSRTQKDYTLDVSGILSFNRFHNQRAVLIPGYTETLSGKYSGQQIGLVAEYGIPFAITSDWNGRWLVGTQLGYMKNGQYAENGGASAQHIQRSHAYTTKSILGVELNSKLSDYSSLTFHTRYFHEFADAATINASFVAGGDSFSMDGVQSGRDSLQLGTGYRYISQGGTIFNVGYDLSVKDRYLGHQVFVKTSWNF